MSDEKNGRRVGWKWVRARKRIQRNDEIRKLAIDTKIGARNLIFLSESGIDAGGYHSQRATNGYPVEAPACEFIFQLLYDMGHGNLFSPPPTVIPLR